MRLVEKEDGCSLPDSGLLYASPKAFPKARHRGLGTIRSGVDPGISVAFEKLEEQGGLADLTRTGEELDTTRCGLGQAASEKLAALGETQPVVVRRHSRITIRLWMKIKAQRDPRPQLLEPVLDDLNPGRPGFGVPNHDETFSVGRDVPFTELFDDLVVAESPPDHGKFFSGRVAYIFRAHVFAELKRYLKSLRPDGVHLERRRGR
jgi:hypothetical protein